MARSGTDLKMAKLLASAAIYVKMGVLYVDTNMTRPVDYIGIVGLQTIDVNIVKLFCGTKNNSSSGIIHIILNLQKHIKLTNSMFAFTSTSGHINRDINDGHGSYTFRLNGHSHHRIGTLLPTHVDGRPRFAQLYIYDTAKETENRFYVLNHRLSNNSKDATLRSLVQHLTSMLNSNNYNLPNVFEVAALIHGDGNPTDCHDVLIEERSTYNVQHISELHPSFMALQYPLLFPYAEDGFHLNLPLNVPSSWKSSRKNVTLREYYAFWLHQCDIENPILHKAGCLFHTYIVDAYTTILDHDLDWYKRNQSTIRSELYNGLHDRITNGETNIEHIGRRVVLPSTFTGGHRYMIQQYHDAMAIFRWAGAPDLFVTITCNPCWIEIARHVKDHIPGQHFNDRLDVNTKMFKIKLDELIKDIMKKHFFGRVKALVLCCDALVSYCDVLVVHTPCDELVAKIELVYKTVGHPQYAIKYSFPSHEEDLVTEEYPNMFEDWQLALKVETKAADTRSHVNLVEAFKHMKLDVEEPLQNGGLDHECYVRGDNDRLVGKWKHLFGKWTSSHLTLTEEKQATIRAIERWDERIYS
ncbi:uncharacterized protein Tco_0305529 [Tanacetum coccineum]